MKEKLELEESILNGLRAIYKQLDAQTKLLQAMPSAVREATIADQGKSKVNLGLGEAPVSRRYIFVSNDGEKGLWYFLGENLVQNHISDRAITGRITTLEIVHKEYKSKEQAKLDITIECDRTYVIRSGFETVFCKTLLLALNTLEFSDLKMPLTIAVSPGTENAVFANVYDAATGQAIKADWDKNADFAAILHKLQSLLF